MENNIKPADLVSSLDEPGLGLLSRLPRTVRDQIYDLCYQNKNHTNALCYQSTVYRRRTNPGTVRFKIRAPLPQLRLLSKTVTQEYNSRAPVNTTMTMGTMMRGSYTFKLDQNASEDALYLPLFTKEDEEASRHENLKVMRFEIAGVLTHSLQTIYFERIAEAPSPGFVRLCLRFYDDPPSDLEGFMRVFSDLEISYTEEGDKDDKVLHLIEVVLQSGGWPLVADEVPVIGTWASQGGFKFNGVASGVYEWPETAVLAAESAGSDGESDGEADGVAEEKTGDPNDLDDASQGSEMEWQFDEKVEELKLSDESSKGDGEEAGDLNLPNEPSDSDESSERDSEKNIDSLSSFSPQERPHDDPSLGLFSRLAQELRDKIYDLCRQEKRYSINLEHGHIPGKIRFHVNAPLPQMRLINSVVKKEYEARAPANTVLFNGGTMWLDYTFSLDYDHRRCQLSTRDPPLWYQKGKDDSPPSNTKAMLFEICGIQTHDAATKSHWVADHGMTTPPEGSFVLSLRFYDDLATNPSEFKRVFGEFLPSYTQELGEPGDLEVFQLAGVSFNSGERKLSKYTALVPTFGTWTPQDGLKLTAPEERVEVVDDSSKTDDETG
jgi:hypothetical protein